MTDAIIDTIVVCHSMLSHKGQYWK